MIDCALGFLLGLWIMYPPTYYHGPLLLQGSQHICSRFSNNTVIQCYFVITMRKKNQFLTEPLSIWSLHILLSTLGYSGFLPYSKGLHIRWSGMSNCPNLSECECVWVIPAMGRCTVQGGFQPGALSCQDRLWPCVPLNWNNWVRK